MMLEEFSIMIWLFAGGYLKFVLGLAPAIKAVVASIKTWGALPPKKDVQSDYASDAAIYNQKRGKYIFWLIIDFVICSVAIISYFIANANIPKSDAVISNINEVAIWAICVLFVANIIMLGLSYFVSKSNKKMTD
jgi:hypothetical protein